MDRQTQVRLTELNQQARILFTELDDNAITRQKMLDDLWELERKTTEMRVQFRRVVTEIYQIIDRLE